MLNNSPQPRSRLRRPRRPGPPGNAGPLSRGPASVSELASPLPISLPAVLQHLKALETSGLVASEKKGRVRTVRMQPDALGVAEDWLARRRKELEAQLDRFENYVATLKAQGEE